MYILKSVNKMTKYIYLCCFLMMAGSSLNAQDFNQDIQKLNLAYKLISTFYVDSVNDDKLVEDAIVGMLNNLDPHSQYISKEEIAKLTEPLDGSFEGIGRYNLPRRSR